MLLAMHAARFAASRPGRATSVLATFAVAAIVIACSACGASDDSSRADSVPSPAPASASSDSAFAAVQARGGDARGMGVDQSTSVHRFDALPDGGRIELQLALDDSAGIATVRAHLRTIVAAFESGDFSTPAFVHDGTVPGTQVLASKRNAVSYVYRELPRGGEVRITTRDAEAVAAVHEFIAFQRAEHHADGAGHAGH